MKRRRGQHQPSPEVKAPRPSPAAVRAGRARLRMACAFLLLMAVVGWGFAAHGLITGSVYYPSKRGPVVTVARGDHPAVYWGCVGFFLAFAAGFTALALLTLREVRCEEHAEERAAKNGQERARRKEARAKR